MNPHRIFKSNLLSLKSLPKDLNKFFLVTTGIHLTALSLLLSKSYITFDDKTIEIMRVLSGQYQINLSLNSDNSIESSLSLILLSYYSIVIFIIFLTLFLYLINIYNSLLSNIWSVLVSTNHFVFNVPAFNLAILSLVKENEFKESITIWISTLVLFVVLITSASYIFFMIPLKTKDLLARSTKGYDILFTFQRHIISLGIIIFESEAINSRLFNSFLLILNLILAFLAIYYICRLLPYFEATPNVWSLFVQTTAASLSVGGILFQYICDGQRIPCSRIIFTAILILPIIFKVAFSFSSNFVISEIRRLSSSKKKISDISPFTAQIISALNDKVNFDLDLNAFPRPKLYTIILHEYIRTFQKDQKYNIESCIRNFLDSIKDRSSLNDHDKLLISFIKYSALKDYFSAFYQAHEILSSHNAGFNLKLGALWIINKVKMDQKIMVEANEKHEIIKSLKLLETYEKMLKAISDYLSNHIHMYKIMMKQSPCFQNLLKITYQTQESFNELDQNFLRLSREDLELCPKIVKFYSLFLMTTQIDTERASELYKLQNKIQLNHLLNIDRDPAHQAITQKNSVCCSISLNKTNFGQIISVSPSFEKLNGLVSSEYSNKYIDIIFPSSLRVHFNEMIREKLKSGDGLHKLTHFNIFLGHKESYLVPVTGYFILNPVINEDLTLMLIFIPFEKKRNFVYFSQDGEFEGATFRPDEFAMNSSDLYKFFKHLLISLNKKMMSKTDNSQFIDFRDEKTDSIFRSHLVENNEFKLPGLLLEISKIRNNTSKVSKHNLQKIDESLVEVSTLSDFDDLPYESKAEVPVYVHNFNSFTQIQDSKVVSPAREKKTRKTILEIQSAKKSYSVADSHDDVFSNFNGDKILDASRSAVSRSSDHRYKRIKRNFDEMISRISIFRFSDRHIMVIFYLIFLVSLMVASYLGYSNATNAVQEVIKSIELMKNLYGRTSSLTDLFRNALNDYLFKNYYNQSLASTQTILDSNSLNSFIRIEKMNGYQYEVKRLLNILKDKTMVDKFYEKNIRVFYDEFENVPNSTFFHLENSFHSYDIMIQASNYLASRLNTNDSSLVYYRDFIATLALNDLFLTSKEYPMIVQESMETIISQITFEIRTIFGISISFLGLYVIVVIISTRKSFHQTSEFLTIMINNDINEICDETKKFEEFQKKIKQELGDESYLKSRSTIIVKESKISFRQGNNKKLLFRFIIFNLGIIVGLLIPNALLIFFNINYSSNINSLASRGAIRIRKLNEIGLSTLEIISDAAIYDFMPHIKSKNHNISDIYLKEIMDLDLVASMNEDNDDHITKYLTTNLCPYFINSTVRGSCQSINNGQAERGIKSSLFFLKDFLLSYKVWADKVPESPEKKFILNNVTARADIDYLCYNAINPAVRVFSRELTERLMDDLDQRVGKVVMLFDISISVNMIILIGKMIWIYVFISKERSVLLNFFEKIPLEILGSNKILRHYLIKESKDFYGLLKEIGMRHKQFGKFENKTSVSKMY